MYLALGVTNTRKSYDGLVAEAPKADPLSGHLFLFCNWRHGRIKALFCDSSHLRVCAKHMEKGTFARPTADTQSIELGQHQLSPSADAQFVNLGTPTKVIKKSTYNDYPKCSEENRVLITSQPHVYKESLSLTTKLELGILVAGNRDA